jgi:hypothetical protein
MKKIAAVEDAKTLFSEAQDWSVWRWLTEKKRVRRAADAANQALDELDGELKAAYPAGIRKTRDPALLAALERCREADAEASAARNDAENTFDEAERCLSAAMAREGARRAIESWQLKETAIRKTEAFVRRAKAGN